MPRCSHHHDDGFGIFRLAIGKVFKAFCSLNNKNTFAAGRFFNSEFLFHAHLKHIRFGTDLGSTRSSHMLRNFRSSGICSELRLLGCRFMRPQSMPCWLFLFVGNMRPGIFWLVFHFYGARQVQCILSMSAGNVFKSSGCHITKTLYPVPRRIIFPAARGSFC